MKKRNKKNRAGGSLLERLEGRVLMSGGVREVTGTVFHDTNSNLVLDAGETTFANVTVFDDVNGNGAVDADEPAATTAANGTYSLSTDAPIFRVRVVPPAHWVASTLRNLINPDVENFPLAPEPSLSGTVLEDHDLD